MILLAHPGISDHSPQTYPPWGVLDVATTLADADLEVTVVDLNGPEPAARLRRLCERLDPRIVGLTGKLGEGARRLRMCLDEIRGFPFRVAVGGPLVSSYPDPSDGLWHGVDALFLGEAETSFLRWVKRGAPKELAPLRGSPADLDAVAMSARWGALKNYVFDGIRAGGERVPTLHVSGARGCTRRCTFCYLSRHLDRGLFRTISGPVLLERCEALGHRTGAKGFYFVDDCLIEPRSEASEKLLDALIASDHAFSFGCDLQLHELSDLALVERLHHAGFRSLYVGVESVTPRIRRLLGKGPTPSDIAEDVNTVVSLGFEVVAALGVGWPTESEGEMLATVALAKSLENVQIDAFRYTPLPGVPLTSFWAKASGVDPSEASIDPYTDYSTRSRSWAPPSLLDPAASAYAELSSLALESRR